MKLTKENVYVNLQCKTKEELTDLWGFLNKAGEKQYLSLNRLLNEHEGWDFFIFGRYDQWTLCVDKNERTEVTIEQLKEILQPMDLTIEQRIEKAEAELNRLKEAIEDSKIKVGDWVVVNRKDTIFKVKDNDLDWYIKHSKKITNPELIKLLEQEIK